MSAIVRGLVAGVVGTAAMTAAQELAAKLQGSGGEQGGGPAEDPWEQAPTPAKVARRVGERVLGVDVPAERIPLLTHAMHWAYGTTWGGVYAALAGGLGRHPPGPVFGTGVWAMSYVQLVPMGLYEPPWRYPPKELALELSYHLAYGFGVARGHRLMGGSRRG